MLLLGKILAIGIGIAIVILMGYLIYIILMFKDESIISGTAYGFFIGDTHQETYDRAVRLKVSGEIEQIHRWTKGSFHFEFLETDLPAALLDNRWTMIVNTDWWNDTIRLEFRDGRLAEIHRFRMRYELP